MLPMRTLWSLIGEIFQNIRNNFPREPYIISSLFESKKNYPIGPVVGTCAIHTGAIGSRGHHDYHP